MHSGECRIIFVHSGILYIVIDTNNLFILNSMSKKFRAGKSNPILHPVYIIIYSEQSSSSYFSPVLFND